MWLNSARLYHYRARAYAPNLGRFMQTDPIGYAAGANLYAYVGGDPVNRIDPMGLQEQPTNLPGFIVSGSRCPSGATCLYDRDAIQRFLEQTGSVADIVVGGARRRQNNDYGENVINEPYRTCPAQERVVRSFGVRSRLNQAWSDSGVQTREPHHRRERGFYALERMDGSILTIGNYKGGLNFVHMPRPPSGTYRSVTYVHTHPNNLPIRNPLLSGEYIARAQSYGVAIAAASVDGIHVYCRN